MTGYEIYCLCRSLNGWSKPSLETYLQSKEKPYFELLNDYFIKRKNFNVKDIRDYIKAFYHLNQSSFDVYKLMNEEANDAYIDWCKFKSTKRLYFEEVKKSFAFIENFCINKGISLSKYKLSYAAKHIREQKIDGAVAVHLQLINKNKLNKVEKLLLKNFLKQYNIIVVRLSNPELIVLLEQLTNDMTKLLQAYQQGT